MTHFSLRCDPNQVAQKPAQIQIAHMGRRCVLVTRNDLYNDYTRLSLAPSYCYFVLVRNMTDSLRKRSKILFGWNKATHVKDNKKLYYVDNRSHADDHSELLLVRSDQREIPSSTLHSANLCAAYFTKWVHSDEYLPISCSPIPTTAMEDLRITPKLVAVILVRFNPHKPGGPVVLHPSNICQLFHIISTPLADLFNKSLDTCVISDDWRRSLVVPIFKAGTKALTNNIRSGRSCLTNLRMTMNFSEAFDVINQSVVCAKLNALEVYSKVVT